MSINAKYNTHLPLLLGVLNAVIFGLIATVDSVGSVDSIDKRNSFNPVVMILLLQGMQSRDSCVQREQAPALRYCIQET